MKQTAEIKCPKCGKVQSEDLYELAADAGDMDGVFPHECEHCEQEFTIEFEFKPFVKTY